MEYDIDRNREDVSKNVGGFKIDSINEISPTQQQTLKHSITDDTEEWFASDIIKEGDLVCICERSPYKSGYVNPLFGEEFILFISLETMGLQGSSEGVLVGVNGQYVIEI